MPPWLRGVLVHAKCTNSLSMLQPTRSQFMRSVSLARLHRAQRQHSHVSQLVSHVVEGRNFSGTHEGEVERVKEEDDVSGRVAVSAEGAGCGGPGGGWGGGVSPARARCMKTFVWLRASKQLHSCVQEFVRKYCYGGATGSARPT